MRIPRAYTGKIFATFTLATVGIAITASPAQAHPGSWSKTRGDCHYSGGTRTDHRYAWTMKDYGGCSGHAWLRIYSNYSNLNQYWESHQPGLVSRSGGFCPDVTFCRVYHKSQSNESWGQSH